ncbi:MAG: DUF4388 domain-containing protein, partial [Deltaproteobacteria bacterium]|nr:DUF4388 domain-containing protein [Deltaproteobacteria bacterium]
VEAAPVEAAPVEAAPVEAAPVEAAPVEAAPVEAAPVEAAPAEAAPATATGADPALLDEANQRAQALQDELNAIKAQLEQEAQAKAELEEKVTSAAQTEEKLNKELKERTSSLLKKNQKIDELQEASKKALEEFEEKHHAHETETANHHMAIEATVDKQLEEIRELAEQLKETRLKLTDESGRYKKEEEERRRLEQDQARLSEREKRATEEKERLKQEKEQAQARADKLADELKDYIQSSKGQLEDELRRRSDDQERWRSGIEERSKLEDQLRDQEQQLLRQENEEATRRLQEQQERQHIEDDIRRQTEQNVRLQLDQERLYQENQEKRRVDALDPNLEPELRENMQSVYGHPSPAPQAFSHTKAMAESRQPAAMPGAKSNTSLGQSQGSIEAGHGTIQGPNEVAILFTDIWRKQVSGRVDFHHQDIHKVVYFERGSPVETFSNQRFDKIEDFLYREGKITRAQYQSLRLRNIQGSRRIGALLVAEGQLKPEELFESVRGHIKEVCASIFEWQQASYQFREEEIEEDQKVRLRDDPRSLIIEGIRRKYLLPRLMTVVGPPSTLLKPLADGQLDAELLGLEARERQAVRMLDGTRNIEEIVFSTGLGPLAIYQVMAGLLTLDLVQVLVRGNEGYNLDGSSSADLLDRRRLEDKVEQTRHQDYFTILGVSRQATPYEITQAHKKLIQEYAPTNFSDAVCNQYKRELIEIERVLDDAYDVLQDDSLRLAYARNLPRS